MVAYVLGVVQDQGVDPDLQIHRQQSLTGNSLLHALQSALTAEVLESLSQVHSLPKRNISEGPEHCVGIDGFDRVIYPAIRRSIIDPLHLFMLSLVQHPTNTPPSTNHLHLPVGRFLALSSWDVIAHAFRPADLIHLPMAHLQWSFRCVVFVEFNKLCTPGVDPVPYVHLPRQKNRA